MEILTQHYLVNGISMRVWEAGPANGPVILFLHGFPEAGFAWQQQLQFFAARGYRALAPDQRGYSRSSKPRGIRAYRIQTLVQDMVSLIALYTREKIILVGHDWGGGVAWHLAIHFPQLLHRLVIINMPHPQVMRQTLKQNRRQQLRSSYAAFFQLPLLPEWTCRAFGFRLLQRSLVRSSVAGTFSPEQLEHYKEAWRQPGALTGMINWYRAYRFFKPKPTGPVEPPTLVIWGKKDAFLLAEMAPQSVARCSAGRLELVPDATHWIHHEQPERVSNLIFAFINE